MMIPVISHPKVQHYGRRLCTSKPEAIEWPTSFDQFKLAPRPATGAESVSRAGQLITTVAAGGKMMESGGTL
jgi:hypothetical protein